MYGWVIAVVGVLITVAFGFAGLGAVTPGKATLFGGAFALLFIAALLAVASRGNSRTD